MAFLERFSKSPTGDELMGYLRKFLAGCTDRTETIRMLDGNQNKNLKELIEMGFYLIKYLPGSREAVFYQVARIYDELVRDHICQLESMECPPQLPAESSSLEVLDVIQSAFSYLLDTHPDVWAPVLSTWALHLLGQMSSQYAQHSVFLRCGSVNETIHIWMSSQAIKSLLDVTAQCLHSSSNKDAFISALLDTSAAHSPYFDWVVAHVGNSFPQTVVTEVLSLGLANFSSNPPQVSKISSVVGILGHLVTTHSKEIQFAFEQILQEGISAHNSVARNFGVPYLLQLCSSSGPLLDVLMDSVLPKVNIEALERLESLIPHWITLHFGGRAMAFVALVTHLILKSTRGPRALHVLMTGSKYWPERIRRNAQSLLDHFTAEISSLIYRSDATRKDLGKSFPCIQALKEEGSSLLIPFLVDNNQQISRVTQQLVKLVSLYDSKDIGMQAVCFLFCEASRDDQLWSLVELVCTLSLKYPTILGECLRLLAVTRSNSDLRHLKTILRLLKSQDLSVYSANFKLAKALSDNLHILFPFIDVRRSSFNLSKALIVVDILFRLDLLAPKKKLKFGHVLTIERYLVELLFNVLAISEPARRLQKVRTISQIASLLQKLAAEHAVQNDALRSLMQSCLNPECRPLFQSQISITSTAISFDASCDEFQPAKFSIYASLLKENKRRTANVSVARVHSTSFQSGRAAKSRPLNWNVEPKTRIVENPDAELNVRLFLSVLSSVCAAFPTNSSGSRHNSFRVSNGKNSSEAAAVLISDPAVIEESGLKISVEAMRKVALLLVEIVSPDVMFNGLPWPDEEFSKVQVERDLQIRRAFEDHPYLWDLLELVANYCPSLCYCSVLLRALMATLMAYWTSCQDSRPASCSATQLQWTVRLINIMKVGQLIPPPLCYVGQTLSQLKPNEILGLLKDIWTYMKMNVPVPTLFVKDPVRKKFLRNAEFCKVDPNLAEKLRLAILNNVEDLGYMFPKFFPLQPPQSQQQAQQGGRRRPQALPDLNNGTANKVRPPPIQSPSPTREIPPAVHPFNATKTVPL